MTPILFTIAASLCWGTGTVLQKHGMATAFPHIALRDAFRRIGEIVRALVANRLWLVGLAIMLTGNACFAMALGSGDIALVQPLTNVTSVVALACGVIFLHERVRGAEVAGIALILAGVVVVTAFAGAPSSRMPSPTGLAAFTLGTVVAASAAVALRRAGASAEFSLSVASGIVFGLGNLMGKLLTQRAVLEAGEPFSLVRGDILIALLTDFPIFLVLAATAVGGVFQHTAYAHGRAGVVTPLVTIMSNMIPLAAAVTIFGETVRFEQFAGVGGIFAGTFVLARASRSA